MALSSRPAGSNSISPCKLPGAGTDGMDTTSDVSRSRTSVKGTSWVTPARFLFALLTIEATLYASEQYQWFAFNRHKNWTVLITIAVAAGATVLMTGWFGIRLLLRKSVQFDLAALLMLIATISIPFAWFADARQQVENERLAIAWLEGRFGGKSFETFDGASRHRRATSSSSGMTTHCGRRRRIRWLRNCLGNDFFDKGMRCVDVGDRFPSDKPDFNASEEPKTYIDYYDEKEDVSNRELVHLSHFHDLEQLGICSRKVTDTGLRSIYGMLRLKKLMLVTPNVTPQAVARLRRRLPKCEVVQYDDFVTPVDAGEDG